MMASSVVRGAKPPPQPPPTYKIGVLRPSTGWEFGGHATDIIFDFAIKRAEEDLNVDFVVEKADCTCGENTIPGFVELKQKGCDFIIGPACSGSAKTILTAPASPVTLTRDYQIPYPDELPPTTYVNPLQGSWDGANAFDAYLTYWYSTSMLSYSADNYAINELMNQNMRAIVDPSGPLRYRTFGISALDKTKPLGEYIASRNHSSVVLVTEDEPYVKGLADGVKLGLGYEPTEYFAANTYAGYLAALQSAAAASTGTSPAVVFNVFTQANSMMLEQALADLYPSGSPPFMMYGGPAFANDGHLSVATGLVAETALAARDERAWASYNLGECLEFEYVDIFGEGPDAGAIYCAQTVEAVRVMTRLMKKHMGDVAAVNAELEGTTPFASFFGYIFWGGYSFPQGMNTNTYFYQINADGEAVPL